jgi:polyprenyldihydroxybenzoate methyltransferase / 3-demethylubiquinol 3-O-methyltransferase
MLSKCWRRKVLLPWQSTVQIRRASTVNADEISHFDQLAATWWDPNGSSRLLHKMNPLRLAFILSLLPNPTTRSPSQSLDGYSILDVGCGGGILTESLARLGADVHGIDASPRAIDVARAHARTDPQLLLGKHPPKYSRGSIQDISVDEKYDIVTAMEVLEHVDYPSAFIKGIGDRVKPGGWMVFSTIARNWVSWLGAIVAAEHVLRIVPTGTHSWSKFINEQEMREFLQSWKDESGNPWIRDITARPCIYNPLTGNWQFSGSGKFAAINYFMAAQRGP